MPFINAGALFTIATKAYERTTGAVSDREPFQEDALVAILFSVAALEAFINEAPELAAYDLTIPFTPPSLPKLPDSVKAFTTLLKEAERSRARTQLKFLLASVAFTGKAYDEGAPPFQDFDLLIELRNDILHLKVQDEMAVTEARQIVPKYPPIIKKLRSRKITAQFQRNDVVASWITLLSTRAAARWACNTAAAMVQSVLNMVPSGTFKDSMTLFYSKPFKLVT